MPLPLLFLLLFARRVFSVFLLYPSSIDRIFLSAYTSLQILYDIDIYILNMPYFLFHLYFSFTLSKTSMIFFSNALPKPFTIISWRFFSCLSFFLPPVLPQVYFHALRHQKEGMSHETVIHPFCLSIISDFPLLSPEPPQVLQSEHGTENRIHS